MPYDINLILDRLIEAFPTCFSRTAPKPLKIGLSKELIALVRVHPALSDVSRAQIRRALKVYIDAPAYQNALIKGGPRYDLDGQPVGEVAPDQQADAKTPRPKPPASPATGYLKMSLRRRIETKRAGLPDQGAAGLGPLIPESHSQPQPTE